MGRITPFGVIYPQFGKYLLRGRTGYDKLVDQITPIGVIYPSLGNFSKRSNRPLLKKKKFDSKGFNTSTQMMMTTPSEVFHWISFFGWGVSVAQASPETRLVKLVTARRSPDAELVDVHLLCSQQLQYWQVMLVERANVPQSSTLCFFSFPV